MLKVFYLVALLLYIGLWIGLALGDVGKLPNPSLEPYDWELPFTVAGMLIIPSILAFLLGSKKD